MTIFDVYRAVIKRLPLILVIVFIAIVGTALVSWFLLDDLFQASATIIVSSQKNKEDMSGLTYNDYTLNIKLVNSYQVLCKADRVLGQVISETQIPLTIEQLRPKITVASQQETEIISISVEDQDPITAQSIANSLADVFQKEVVSIMKMDNVQIIDYATTPVDPVSPNRIQNVIFALLAGLMLGIGVAVLIDYFDITIKSTDQIEKILGVPVLGWIPHIEQGKTR